MAAALQGQAEDIAADRSLTPEQRFPVIGKIGVLQADCDGAPLDGGEPRLAPQQWEPIGQGEGARKQPIARRSGCRIETGCRVPEQALKDEPTAKILHRCGDNAAGTDDSPHFAHRLADEIERELRQRRGETALDVREAAGIRDGEIYAGGALPGACKGDIRMGGINARRPSAPSPLGQDEGEAPGPASDVEHTAFLTWIRQIYSGPESNRDHRPRNRS